MDTDCNPLLSLSLPLAPRLLEVQESDMKMPTDTRSEDERNRLAPEYAMWVLLFLPENCVRARALAD